MVIVGYYAHGNKHYVAFKDETDAKDRFMITDGFHDRPVTERNQGKYEGYEVKSSVEDFHSKNGHNFLGDYNYYVMPEEVYEQIKKEIPYQVGVYVPDGMNYRGEWYDLKAIKKAKRKDRSRPVSEMLLMMFRSAARDRRCRN